MKRPILPAFVLVGLTAPALAQTPFAAPHPKLLIHGNYCGPGNNAPLPPVDALDRACAHHDACTPRGGLPSPACNARLRAEAEAVSRDPRQPGDLRALAGLVAAGAALLPSDPRANAVPRYAAPYPGAYAPVAHRPRVVPLPDTSPDPEDDED